MPEDNIFEPSYPPYQATWQDGRFNITIRGSNKADLIGDLMDLKDKLQKNLGSNPDEFKSQEASDVSATEKCPTCNGSMQLVTKGKRRYICNQDNGECKNNKGYSTTVFIN